MSYLIHRCTEFITLSGECVNDCDEGYQITVFPNSTLSARVCEGQHVMKILSLGCHFMYIDVLACNIVLFLFSCHTNNQLVQSTVVLCIL